MERKEELASLDVFYLCRELNERLAGGAIKKVYQISDSFMLKIRVRGRGELKLYLDQKKAYLSDAEFEAPRKPPNFCMLLRKHLEGRRIVSVSQPGFERIIEIRAGDARLAVEFIRPGNVILVDPEGIIIMPLKAESYRDREVRPRAAYSYPPRGPDPVSMDFSGFMRSAGTSDKKLVSFLAADMGFGGPYANEICMAAGIESGKSVKMMDKGELFAAFGSMKGVFEREVEPTVYEDVFVSPFEMRLFAGKNAIKTGSFSESLSSYFSLPRSGVPEKSDAERKLERIEESRNAAREKWEAKAEEKRDAAQAVYNNYALVKGITEALRKGREKNIDWKSIKERIARKDTAETRAIKDIREHEAVVVLSLEDIDVELDFTKTVEENAALLFENAKKARRKIEGIEKSMAAEPHIRGSKPEKKAVQRKKWHESFRHFMTTDGFLVVAGRNAEQNETLFRKYLKTGDIAFHADIQGAGLVVVKSAGKPITPEAKREAAEFAAVHSKAWKAGIGNVNVYAVRPEQMGKKDPEGHPLPKGAFSLTGEREWFRDIELKLALGARIDRAAGKAELIYGPVISVRRHASYFTTIKPGSVEAIELAGMVRKRLLLKSSFEDKPLVEAITPEEIQNAIPSGVGTIIDFG